MKKHVLCALFSLLALTCYFPTSLYAEKLSQVVGKVCIIRSAMNNNYVVDVNDGGIDNGTNIQLYHANNTPAQTFIISPSKEIGYYGNCEYTIK